MFISSLKDSTSWTLGDPYLNWNILLAADLVRLFFSSFVTKYYPLLSPPLLFWKQENKCFVVPRKCYKVVSQVRSSQLQNFCFERRPGQNQQNWGSVIISGEKNPETSQGLCLPLHKKIQTEFFQLVLDYFENISFSLCRDRLSLLADFSRFWNCPIKYWKAF